MNYKRSRSATLSLTAVLIITLLASGMVAPLSAQNKKGPTQAGMPYPRRYALPGGGVITLYEPQIASWFSQTHMEAWSAVSYESQPGAKPAIGSIKIEADTDVAIDERLVRFRNFTIPEVNFSTLSRDDSRRITSELTDELPDEDKTFPLDKILAAVDRSQLLPKTETTADIKADPPNIFYSDKPAILVGLDGDPVWSPVKDVDLKYAVNTNWDLFQQPSTKMFYLRNDTNWYRSNDLNAGWVPAGKLPASFSKLPAVDDWKDVRANLPGKAISANKMPKIFLSTAPAEVIVVQGKPKYTPVPSTSLLWVNNTEADIFRNGPDGDFYYLVAGRWFSAPALNGPWTFATPDLPADFQKIPLEHPRSRVLVSVPGTDQATEAILQANVPRTARVNKKELKAPEVVYQGDPNFQPVKDTMLWRAVNTDKDIIKYEERYFMCYQAVWFVSMDPKGPWTVAEEIPSEIYKIPASSPLHNVTYVTIKESDPVYVTVSYLPAYTGMMVGWGCVVWGTGWYYPPYVYYGGYYPVYYPYYRTYGYAAWYNPYTGYYGRGAAAYGPYGGVGFGAVYNPYTGTYARGATAYGPYGSRTFAQAYNPRTGTYAQTRQGSNVYGSWGSSYVQRGDSWAQTGRVTNNMTGNTTAGIRTSGGAGAVTRSGNNGRTTVGKSQSGDIYAGHDGNVYKKTGDGWQKYENGNWNSAGGDQRQAAAASNQRSNGQKANSGPSNMNRSVNDQLNRDANARAEGARRTQDLGSYRSNMGGRTSAGSFRGGGFGGGRGGGRRR